MSANRVKSDQERIADVGENKIREFIEAYEGLHYHQQKLERAALRNNTMQKWGMRENRFYKALAAFKNIHGEIKICQHCKKQVSSSEKKEGSGYHIDCARERARANSKKLRGNLMQRTKEGEKKKCENCQKNLPLIKFSGETSSICISCRHNLSINHPKTEREINEEKAARVMRPRIAKTKAGKKIARNWRGKAIKFEDLFKICESECWFCEEKLELWQIVEVDHIVPLESGGLHNRFNIAPIHQSCNQFKGAFNVLEAELGPDYRDRAEQARANIKKYYS